MGQDQRVHLLVRKLEVRPLTDLYSHDMNEDKIVVITGSSRGIGLSISNEFTNNGWKTVGINRSKCETTDECLCADLSVDRGIEDAALYIRSVRPHVLINNAGANKIQRVDDLDGETVDWLYRLNQKAPLMLARAACSVENRRLTSIINIGSIWGQIGCEGRVVYGMTKAAISSMTRHLASELKHRGVKVNAIAPGFTETGLTAQTASDPVLKPYMQRSAPKQIMDPEEIAKMCIFLANDRITAMNGQTITIDGGLTYG